MPRLLSLGILLAALVSARAADTFSDAENAFIAAINSLDGIELVGGPFQVIDRYVFGDDLGYFNIAPSVRLSGIDQRLSVQTRRVREPGGNKYGSLPIVTGISIPDVSKSERMQILSLLALNGFAERRDEVTLFTDGSVRTRAVQYLPILKVDSSRTNSLVLLVGAQSWQGIPLYRASIERFRRSFELEMLREGFALKRPLELGLRPMPIYSPQTFFAQPGAEPEEWQKALATFSRLELPAVEIRDALVDDRTLSIRADTQGPILPQFWIQLDRTAGPAGEWSLHEAIELRAEFPRPAQWWSFLPLLPARTVNDHPALGEGITSAERAAIGTFANRLRGVGEVASLKLLPGTSQRTIRVRTTHASSRGYELDFAFLNGAWRLVAIPSET